MNDREKKILEIRKMLIQMDKEVDRNDFYKLIPDKRSDALDLRELSKELNISELILQFWVRELNLNVTADGCVYKDVFSRMPSSSSSYVRTPKKNGRKK